MRIQSDLHCMNEEEEDCMLTKQTAYRNIRIVQKAKYLYCPKQLQPNHSMPEFTIQIKCWLIKLVDDTLDRSIESDETKVSTCEKRNDELIVIQSWIRTYTNYKIPFKTVHLRTQSSGLVRFSLSLLEKFPTNDLKNILSLELELRLNNGAKETINIHFYHSNPIRNLNLALGSKHSDQAKNQIKLIVNRYEAKVNDTITLHIESSSFVKNVFLVQLTNGQLLNVQLVDTKTRLIRIKENMFPFLELIAYALIDHRLIHFRTSLKINRRSNAMHSKQMLTSFNKLEHTPRLRIKLWSLSNSFVHIRSIRRDLDRLENVLNFALPDHIDESDALNDKSDFALTSDCFLIRESFDRCINHFKFNEPQTVQTSLTTAVDHLFFNHTKKPFYFEILFYSEYCSEYCYSRRLVCHQPFALKMTNKLFF